MTASPGHISAHLLVQFVELARRHGLDAASLCEQAGLKLATLYEPEARVPFASLLSLTEALASRVRNPALGLEVAQLYDSGSYGVVGLVMMASPTLREGLARAFRYQRVWEDSKRFSFEPCEGGGKVVLSRPEPWLPVHRIILECILAEVLQWTRSLTRTPVKPLWVHFWHEPPRDTSVYESFFGVPVSFGASATEIAFSDATLDLPLTHANALFLSFFEQQAQVKAAQLAPMSSLNEQVRAVLRQELAGGDFSQAAVATKLHMTPRTLQRRLKEEGSSHEALLDGLRHDLARVYLEKQLSISEISFLLGYSNPTTFHRAFKRWTGFSPEHYRAYSGGAGASPGLAALDGRPE